jgi:hypothetical protein
MPKKSAAKAAKAAGAAKKTNASRSGAKKATARSSKSKPVGAKLRASGAAPNAARVGKPRRVKPGKYKAFRLQRRIRHPVKLPNVWKISRKAALTLWAHKKLFIGITVIYGLINLCFAQGLASGTDVASIKDSLDQVFTGHFGFILSGLSIFVAMVGSAGNTTSQTAGAYQIMLALTSSLAMIWALRQSLAGKRVRVRDAFYRGMYPLVPFLLVLVVVGAQLIPLILGSTLYSIVINNGIAIYLVEKVLWGLLFAMLALLTVYMLTSSLFALYIVTLPDMTPVKALRSARELVRYRRWTVLRKLLCLPIILLLVALVIMLPVILVVPPLARWVFFVLTMFGLLAIHAYMYTLYRELLNE